MHMRPYTNYPKTEQGAPIFIYVSIHRYVKVENKKASEVSELDSRSSNEMGNKPVHPQFCKHKTTDSTCSMTNKLQKCFHIPIIGETKQYRYEIEEDCELSLKFSHINEEGICER